jgi:alginate O-acetyltransferase complex protein AlgI
MNLTSLEYAIFLPLAFTLYWSVAKATYRLQNLVLLVSSCVFYAWWDWRFLLLIGLTSIVDFFVGHSLSKTRHATTRKLLLSISVVVNLGTLGFFKYYNFFYDSLLRVAGAIGLQLEPHSLHILLPIALSYYTLQTMGYSIDVFRQRATPTRDILAFLAYILFFPKLLAGPIERASTCLPQFHKKRFFDYHEARDGLRQTLWGLFKKTVIADNCATCVGSIFDTRDTLAGSTLFLGLIYFAVQIYCDFSGYSDMAVGTSRLFGIALTRNFSCPYFSRTVAEFWRRWHISLSTWLRDYIFLPLSYSLSRAMTRDRYLGMRTDRAILSISTLFTFLVCGLWHGANWTFVLWGLLHGIYLLPQHLRRRRRQHSAISGRARSRPSLREAIQIGRTFILVTLAWVFFRAATATQAVSYLQRLCSASILSPPRFLEPPLLLAIGLLFLAEWVQRTKAHVLQIDTITWLPLRWGLYYMVILLICVFHGGTQGFIYFQY